MIHADPSGRFVLHVDLGLDKIFIWEFDATAGKLSPSAQAFVELPPGDGPRHFHFPLLLQSASGQRHCFLH